MKVTKIVCHSSNGSMLSLYVEHYCNDTIVERKEQILSNEGDTAFINKFEDGTYSFGIIQGDYYSMGHRKGYIWSSRASVMNKIFGTDIMDVGIKLPNEEGYFSRAVDIKTLKKILPENWDIVKEQFGDGEVYNTLKYIGDTPIEYKCGKRLYSNEGDSCDVIACLNTIFQNQNV